MTGFSEWDIGDHRVRVEVESFVEFNGRLKPIELLVVVTPLDAEKPLPIATDFLRRIPMGRVLKGLRRLRHMELELIEAADRAVETGEDVIIGAVEDRGPQAASRPGARPPAYWDEIASLYDEAARQHPPESPRKYISRTLGIPVGTAASHIQRAAERGYIKRDRKEG